LSGVCLPAFRYEPTEYYSSTAPSDKFPSKSPTLPPTSLSIEYEDGDIILRADDTDFRVHATILRQASPFFHSLFTLPQPKGTDELPVIPMSEDAEVLHTLIRIIYPVRYKLSISSLDFASRLLIVAEKFEIECAMDPIHASITQLLEDECSPLRAWALAIRLDDIEARRSAVQRYIGCEETYLLKQRVEELRYVNALDYLELVDKRENALLEAQTAIAKTVWGCSKCGKTPAWRTEYERAISGLNPFSRGVASDLLFEICAHRSGCPMCIESVRGRNRIASTKTPMHLRVQLKEILAKCSS